MYIETSSPRVQDEVARLESGLIPNPNNQMCVTFWYHMFGDHVQDLNIYTKTLNGLGTAKWTRSGTKLDQWYQGDFSVVPTADFQVKIDIY